MVALRHEGWHIARSHEIHSDLTTDEIHHQSRQTFEVPIRRAIFDGNVSSLGELISAKPSRNATA